SQASHWKDDQLTNQLIGLMDPTLNFGVSYGPTEADVRALDVIGYNRAPVPEPASLAALGLGALALLRRRKKSK
ncbi:MAG: PEP-CTERM sorting domain-containing protein, partial [Chlorobia bacterium]|nr:PEP-CTERM sorting domain-containing protein [Fimbriimonadaceae bacterium]